MKSLPSSLGSWKTPKQAATAYDRAALFYLGEDAFLNFPKLRNEIVPASAERLRAEANVKRKRKTSSRYVGVQWATKKGARSAVIVARRKRSTWAVCRGAV